MRFATLFLAAIASTEAFAPVFFTRSSGRTAFVSSMRSHIDKDFTADSGMNIATLPVYIDNLDVDNFEESLEMFEALLANECVGDDICEDYVSQLADKAKSIGKDLPPGFGSKHH
mmetsp:Transcript_35573/g.101302  ORF Transcript_35573/g.101302 Transcript_35573/m.101302 type:complete len:115 (+) Transcript_35573:89-433(+)|eukprot:CAMPEP_0176268552 /NCGR_PEP_ID=MMETSP0121_2-20121125/43732_1 /TAXON_ID=160619 /ORGANISM="Kryptoperidinium foliaceum, Strain CCMP 1326" /LENGTH=114 /DNA_ID=CAMNT_0017608647 /DNA_START=85 /DNA_END=429 /DNA_ORIENTATION=-